MNVMRAIVETMKGIITLMACLVAVSVYAEPSPEPAPYIQLTLAAAPPISIDGSTAQSFVDPWGKPYSSKGFLGGKKNQDYGNGYKLFDLPGPGYRKQFNEAK